MSDMDLNQILSQGRQIPVMLPEDTAAMKEQEARQARVIGLNTAVALVQNGLELDGADALGKAKNLRSIAHMVSTWVLDGRNGDQRD